MIRIGIVGAGHIAAEYMDAYATIDDCEVVAICDLNETLAAERAKRYGKYALPKILKFLKLPQNVTVQCVLKVQ